MESARKALDINIYMNRIILSGDLDGSPETLKKLREGLDSVRKFSSFTVEAQDVLINPEGITAWIQATEQFLMGCELIYLPSQLGMILQYDTRYKHPTSSFQEYNSHSSLQDVGRSFSYEPQKEEVAAYGSNFT
jgi:hypothetical protein